MLTNKEWFNYHINECVTVNPGVCYVVSNKNRNKTVHKNRES